MNQVSALEVERGVFRNQVHMLSDDRSSSMVLLSILFIVTAIHWQGAGATLAPVPANQRSLRTKRGFSF
jgi:hypothetical protein